MDNLQSYSIINDAVHKVMSFPEDCKGLLKLIIDSETFQRLRHIKQLGMTELIFPTAVHNRFSHCLGASYVAFQMAQNLGLSKDETRYCIVSTLLHDIGHGPFSHAFEKFLISANGIKIKHEDWTESFLKEFGDELARYDIDYKILSQLIQRKYDRTFRTYNIVADITSSQLDADRLDYLLRDSHFCGVPYGNTDISWIVKHLTVMDDDQSLPRLGVLQKGWRAVEHFLLCRRIMVQNVYKHHKKNAIEKLLHEFLLKLADGLIHADPIISSLIANKPMGKFLENAAYFRENTALSSQFVERNFSSYKQLTDYDIWTLIRDFSHEAKNHSGAIFKIAHRIYNRQLPLSFKFSMDHLPIIQDKIEKFKDYCQLDEDTWQIFITDSDVMIYETQDDPIHILDVSGRSFPLHHYSDLLNQLGDRLETESYLAIDQELWMTEKDSIQREFSDFLIFPQSMNNWSF